MNQQMGTQVGLAGRRRSAFLAPLLAILATLTGHLGSAQEAPVSLTELGNDALPVTHLVATTSGVATFVHEGIVRDDATWELPVPIDAMDDLLQTLVLEDLDGGTIQPVRYATRDALERSLASFDIDLRSVASLADLLQQARGAAVTLEAAEAYEGVLVAVERVASSGETAAYAVTLRTDVGLQRVALAEVQSLQFADADLQADLDAALDVLDGRRSSEEAVVRLHFAGEGERRVRVRYIRELPVWKPSYRLVVREDGVADLQAWAILDNPTDLDLHDVQVTFLAGAPVAFRTLLFEPRWVDRPSVAPAVTSSMIPGADAGSFAAEAAVGAPLAMFNAEARVAPSPEPALVDAGMRPNVETSRTASAYAFTVQERVDVPRQSSAMVPLLTTQVPAYPATVVTTDAHAMRAVWFRNSTTALLPAGTVTLFDAAGFAGNALVGDLAAGGERWLRYAGDLGMRVQLEGQPMERNIVRAYLDGAVLVQERRERQSTRVRLVRDDDEARTVIVEHPAPAGWDLVAPVGATPLRGEGTWRIGVTLLSETGAPLSVPELPIQVACDVMHSCEFDVVLERIVDQRLTVGNLRRDELVLVLQNVELDEGDRERLAAIVTLQEEVADLDEQLGAAASRRRDLFDEQARLRDNMAVLDQNADLYRRYLRDLTAQEDELATLLDTLERLRTTRAERQAELDAALRDLADR